MTIAPAATDVAREFVAALSSQDFDRLERCLASNVDFHAVVPGTGSFREQSGAADTAAQFRKWFGDATEFDLLSSSVETVVDRIRIAYRFGALEDGQWHVVEQTAYATIGGGGIEKLDVACSGFRPVDDRPR